jgi:fumarylacetoacetase
MTTLLDATHDPHLRSWVPSANEPNTDFPIQNLPYGRFRRKGSDEPWRIGVAIGDQVLDLHLARDQCPWGSDLHALMGPLAGGDLRGFMSLGPVAWKRVRAGLSQALALESDQGPFLELCLVPRALVEMALPCVIGDYTDFYAGIHHARNIGRLFRPDSPLLPNCQWVPIGYHGRASSIGLGGPVKRPRGQLKGPAEMPEFAPCRRLDYELEVGALVGASNEAGHPVDMQHAEAALFGLVLLNDWSARDIQAWEYQPLGPFLSKSFATSISPWVVTMDALAPFRRPFVRPEGDPQPLPYLDSPFNREAGALDIVLEAWLQTAAMKAAGLPAHRLSRSNLLDAYWTWAQMLTHHTSNGCNLQLGDLLGSGTISGPGEGQGAAMIELTQGGKLPLPLPGGEQRSFLEDGDTVALRAFCQAPGAARIGFGPVVGTITPA